jgi:hypothetical protein
LGRPLGKLSDAIRSRALALPLADGGRGSGHAQQSDLPTGGTP